MKSDQPSSFPVANTDLILFRNSPKLFGVVFIGGPMEPLQIPLITGQFQQSGIIHQSIDYFINIAIAGFDFAFAICIMKVKGYLFPVLWAWK